MEGEETFVPPVVFGRQPTLKYLEQRVQHSGLTAVVGGPMAGKSAVMSELDRRLRADGEFLVGRYEAKGGEVSHFLYAISNLYERWLADANMREQAMLLWKRHSSELIPRVGQGFGRVLKALGGKESGIAELVSSTFDGLKDLQEELKSGGLSLAPLPYDQTRELANLVAEISGRRVVLILDDWGRSADPLRERQTLESFLKHAQEWPRTHIVIAARRTIGAQPEAEDLSFLGRSELGQTYELPPLDLSSELERRRLLLYLREKVPASREASDDEIIELIGGMPGVLSRWIVGAELGSVTGLETLRQKAEEAHSFRYTDLTRALDRLPKEALLLCARVAFLPRFNRQIWDDCRSAVFEGLDRSVLDNLVGSVLERYAEDVRIPSFGHQTRHAAARRHIARQQPYLMARVADALIENLATKICGVGEETAIPVAVLTTRKRLLTEIECSELSQFMIAAATSMLRKPEAIAKLRANHALLKGAAQRVPGITPLVAMGLVNRGVQLIETDFAGAIADFTAVIDLPGVPNYPLMKALFNRANCRKQIDDRAGARADLCASESLLNEGGFDVSESGDYGMLHFELGEYRDAVFYYSKLIDSPSASPEQRGKAFKGRGAAKRQLNDGTGAIADFTAAFAIEETPAHYKAAALSARGETKYSIGDVSGSLADFVARIEFPLGAVAGTGLALAYLMRGLSRQERGEQDGAIADFSQAINSSDATGRERAQAFLLRGLLQQHRNHFGHANADFSGAIALGSAGGEFLAKTHLARAALLMETQDGRGARDDLIAAVNTTKDAHVLSTARRMTEGLNAHFRPARSPDSAAAEMAFTLNSRAVSKGKRGDMDGEIADYTEVIELPNAPADQMALALHNRGVRRSERGDTAGAIADYTAVIKLANAPTELVARALGGRSDAKSVIGDNDGALADCTALVDLPNAPDDQVAAALYSRGVMKSNHADVEGAIADYTAVIARANSSVDLVAKAQYNRGVRRGHSGDGAGAIADFTAVIELPNVPATQAAYALHNRGVWKSSSGDANGAVADYTAAINLPNAPPEVVEVAQKRLAAIVASSDGS
jgi:tetratricopeptide (TPR) repeat protein